MKKRFTRILAALALLVGLTIPMGVWGQTVTFSPSDFQGQGNSNGGDEITATHDGITFYCDKGYGYSNNQFRCYSGGTITISSTNKTITGISFNFSSTNYTGGLSGSYTPNATSWSHGLTGSAARITSCVVTYSDGGGSNPTMSVSTNTIDFGSKAINPQSAYEESFEVSFANLTQNLTVSVGSSLTGVSVTPTTILTTDSSPATVTVSYNPTTAGNLSGNITVGNTADNLSATVAVTGSAYDPASVPTYALVSDAGTLHAGDIIILGCASKNAVAGEMGSNAYFTKVDATFTDGTVSTNAAIQITLGGSAGAWTLTTSEGQIGVSTTNLNHEGGGTTTWAITISNNVAHINGGSNNGDIQYNASNPRFKTYTSTQTSIEIYKLVNENQVATPTFSV